MGAPAFDRSTLSRALYSSDASLYRVVPEAVCVPANTRELTDAVDRALFIADVPGTRGWSRVSRSEQFEEDTGRHHVALRYSFAYSLQD